MNKGVKVCNSKARGRNHRYCSTDGAEGAARLRGKSVAGDGAREKGMGQV